MADSKEDMFLLAVAQKMGLGTVDLATFMSKVATNSQIRSIVLEAASGSGNTSGQAIDPKYNKFLEVLGQRFKADAGIPAVRDGFIDKLNADLKADPALAAKLKSAITSNPNIAANQLALYQHGQLKATVDTLDALVTAANRPAPPPPPPASAPAPAPVVAADKPPAKPPAARPPVLAPRPPADAAAPAPVAAAPAPAPEAAPAPAPTPAAAPAALNVAEARRLAAEQVLATFASPNTTDDTISESITPDMVKAIAGSIGKFAKTNYPQSIGLDADKFQMKIEASPELQQQIADNLAKNPKLVRSLALAMGPGGKLDLNKPMVRSAVENTLKTIFNDPEKLAEKKYTDSLYDKMSTASNSMDQLTSFMRSIGFDARSMGNLGPFMSGLGRQLAGNFDTMMHGDAYAMGNPKGKGLFAPINMSWSQADHDVFLSQYATVVAKPGAKGPVSDGTVYTLVEKAGEPPTREATYDPTKDHRIAVKDVRGVEFKVFATSGLSPTRLANGNYDWTLATKVDDRGQPRHDSMKTIVLDPTESGRLFAEMSGAGAKKIVDPASMSPTGDDPQLAVRITRVDHITGRTGPDTVPARPIGAPRPEPEVAPS